MRTSSKQHVKTAGAPAANAPAPGAASDAPAPVARGGHDFGRVAVTSPAVAGPVVQREEEKPPGFDFQLTPPELAYNYRGLGGHGGLSLGLGGAEATYQNGPFYMNGGASFGREFNLNMGVGAPLQPWMMDVNKDLGEGAQGMNSVLNGGGVLPNLGHLGGFGVLGDVADAGKPSPFSWGAGLQLQSTPDDPLRVMLGVGGRF